MVASREGSTTTTTTTPSTKIKAVLFPSISLGLLSQKSETSNVKTFGNQKLFEDSVTQVTSKDHWAESDLSALLHGTVKCTKEKPPSTKQTKKEAFDRYMNIIYGLPLKSKIYLEDTFDPNTFSFYHKLNDNEPRHLPPLKEDVRREPEMIASVVVKKKKPQEKKTPSLSSEPKPPIKVEPQPVEKVTPKTEEPPEIIPPVEQPKAKTPAPPSPPPPLPLPPRPRTPTSLPPREPSPEVPTFLKQFADEAWFGDLFPDKTTLPSSLSPEDFCLQLLRFLDTCSTSSRLKILAALQTLHTQKLLQNTHALYLGLTDMVPKFVRPNMSPLEKTVLVELLNLLLRLKSASDETVKNLLTLLAFKNLDLWEMVVSALTSLGVDEVEQWLCPELETWDLELQDQDQDQDQADRWRSLHDRAECWLQLWISKYKEHGSFLHLSSTAQDELPSVSAVDVLNYFCSVQKELYRTRHVAPADHNNTVLLPLNDHCRSQAIFRLGETNSMTRIRKPAGIILPPLRNRPFLTHFPHFISFPLPRITLRPFHSYSDEDWQKASPCRYFIHQQSCVDYYR